MLVQQILASKGDSGVITVAPGTTVQEVAALLSSKRIGAVIVSADGKAEGIVSERDIVRELGKRGAAAWATRSKA
jgi:CBS domain-containing protein